jgi:hypothetical protein
MVSPMALDVATIKLATMPDIAAGNTTLEEITDFRAPSPAPASRKSNGTAFMASSETEATRGIVNSPTPTPAAAKDPAEASSLSLPIISGAMKNKAKKPNTTLGTPARISKTGLIKARVRLEAYSDRYMAAAKPIGPATAIAIPVVMSVATNKVFTSYSPRRGYQPSLHVLAQSMPTMKSQASENKEKTKTIEITTEIRAVNRSRNFAFRSLRTRRGAV